MVIGAALVLATWLICIAALVVVGLPFGLRRLDRLTTVRIRQSLWMGLLVITVMLLGMSLVRPLGSGPVLAAVSVGVLIMGAIATLMGLRFRGLADIRVGRAPRRFWLPILLVLIVVSAIWPSPRSGRSPITTPGSTTSARSDTPPITRLFQVWPTCLTPSDTTTANSCSARFLEMVHGGATAIDCSTGYSSFWCWSISVCDSWETAVGPETSCF